MNEKELVLKDGAQLMAKAIEHIPDAVRKKKAKIFIRKIEKGDIKSSAAIYEAYSSLLALANDLGPASEDIRRTIQLMKQIVERMEKYLPTYLDGLGIDETKKEFLAVIEDLEANPSAENFERIKRMLSGEDE